MSFEIQIFEVFTVEGGTNTYTVIAGDKWKRLETIVERVPFEEALIAAKKAVDNLTKRRLHEHSGTRLQH